MEQVYQPTDAEREQLRTPRGEVVQGAELRDRLEERAFDRCIAVGDRVALDLADWGNDPDIAIVDGRIQREDIERDPLDSLRYDAAASVDNPAGGVTVEAWRAVREAVARTCTTAVAVGGEEDLLALPAITFASPDSVVVYGQRDTGAVILEPDIRLKTFVDGLVEHRTYGRVIVGGSWDRLHAGHRSLLLEAFARGEEVDVGITSDRFAAERSGDADIAAFSRRKDDVAEFLDRFGLADRARLLEIDDFRGTAVEVGDALVVTGETLDNARRINDEREEAGRDPLDLVEVSMVAAADGAPLSSSRIRKEEIDRNGLLT